MKEIFFYFGLSIFQNSFVCIQSSFCLFLPFPYSHTQKPILLTLSIGYCHCSLYGRLPEWLNSNCPLNCFYSFSFDNMFFSYTTTKQRQITFYLSLIFLCLFLIFIFFYALVSLVTLFLVIKLSVSPLYIPPFCSSHFSLYFFNCTLISVSNIFFLMWYYYFILFIINHFTPQNDFLFYQIKLYIQKNLMHQLKLFCTGFWHMSVHTFAWHIFHRV